MPNMTHLHVHGECSFLDGMNRYKDLAKRVKELGMNSVAITEHGHLAGIVDFYNTCKEEGVKPILGMEGYYTWDSNTLSLPIETRTELAIEKAKAEGINIPPKAKKKDIKSLIEPYTYDTKQYHIILIAINQIGWSNLIKLQSEAADKCTFNGRYCMDDELLEKYNEGIIMTTACVGNNVATLINEGRMKEAREQLLKWKSIFGDRLYLEIQPLRLEKQLTVNFAYMNWAKSYDIKTIATCDAHYTLKEDWDDHDTLLCVGTGKVKSDLDRMRYTNDFWIKSYDEMIESFENQAELMKTRYEELFDIDEYMNFAREAIENTNLIADMIEDIKLGSDTPLLPEIDIPTKQTPEDYLTLESYKGLYKYKKEHPEINIREYERRLVSELNVINKKGFAPYMLIVKDFIHWCDINQIPTGPGRGSAAGSLSLFCNDITKVIDPIKFKLLFFRFLTMDRTDLPDIDVDVAWDGRGRLIDYLKQKYGANKVAHIGNLNELGVKSGLKDVGRALGIDFDVVNAISKKIDAWSDDPNLCFRTLDDLKDGDDKDKAIWNEFHNCELQHEELFRVARKLEGLKRNTGTHASGILITPIDVNDMFPTRQGEDGTSVVMFTGPQVEQLGGVKFDVLGLKTLTVLDKTLKAIKNNPFKTVIDFYKQVESHFTDTKIFEMIRDKQTEGLFQIESNLFKGLIEGIQPDNINDIVVMNSIGRPGPLSAGMDKAYANRKHGKEEKSEPLYGTWDIVADTLGTICYQEQCMLIAKKVAGFDDSQSDSILRKALAKKKKDKMELSRQLFIYGKKNEPYPEGYDKENKDQVLYDPNGKYGAPVKGGINNGYLQKELATFWESLKGYASYLFNLSHAACYSFTTLCTAYLKRYYPAEFFAALLTMQDKQEKIDNYIRKAGLMGIIVSVPNINLSNSDFIAIDNTILYGFNSIKGVGASSIPEIIKNKPYTSLEDAIEKLDKKFMNKRVGTALIKAGAFDEFNENRNVLMNQFYDIRKIKDAERLNEEDYDQDACMGYEQEVLGTTISYIPWWETINKDEKVVVTLNLKTIREQRDKNGNMMAFVTGEYDYSEIKCVIFAKTYCNNADQFDMNVHDTVTLKGRKDDKGCLIVSGVVKDKETKNSRRSNNLFDDLIVNM